MATHCSSLSTVQFLGFSLLGHNHGTTLLSRGVMHVQWHQAQRTANPGQTKECQQPASDNSREYWTLISAHLSSLLRKFATWDNPTNNRAIFNQIKVKEGAPWPWCRRDISIIYYLSGAGLCHWISIHVSRYRYLEEKCSPAEVMLSPGLTDEMIP